MFPEEHFGIVKFAPGIVYMAEEYSIEPLTNNHICTVIVIDEPEATAFSHVFISLAESKGFYCLTLEKAYSILKIPISIERFMELVQIGLNQ